MSSLAPMMLPTETEFLTRNLQAAKHYLEFGGGGSTKLALSLGVPRVTTVESHPGWIENLRADPEIVAAEDARRLTLLQVDIGPSQNLGFPLQEHASKWPRYYREVWKHVEAREIDLVLVDGRFRVACALMALSRCAHTAKIIVHDFWDREYYHALLRFTRVVDRVDNIVELTAADEIDWRAFGAAAFHFALDPR